MREDWAQLVDHPEDVIFLFINSWFVSILVVPALALAVCLTWQWWFIARHPFSVILSAYCILINISLANCLVHALREHSIHDISL